MKQATSNTLTQPTIEAIEYLRDIAVDEDEAGEHSWQFTIDEFNRALESGALNPTASASLYHYVLGDRDPAEERAIMRDLCRAGFFAVCNPEAVCTGRRRTMTVDGVRYEV